MPCAKTPIDVVGIDIGKNSFHVVGLDRRGAIVLRQKWSRGQIWERFANMPPRLIGMEACARPLSQLDDPFCNARPDHALDHDASSGNHPPEELVRDLT